MRFPVSIKGVLFYEENVVLLENERNEWELPGGKLETGEDPSCCVIREIREELSVETAVDSIIDCWLYEVLPQREVLIVTYGVHLIKKSPLRVSDEHQRIGVFSLADIEELPMPEGYRRSIRHWATFIKNKACR